MPHLVRPGWRDRRHQVLGLAWLATWLGVDAGVALGWLLGGPQRTSADFYLEAERLTDMPVYAGILLVVTVLLAVRPTSPWPWIAGSLYWSWWAFVSSLAALQPDAGVSMLGPLATLGLAASHGATGLLLAWMED